MDEAHLKISSCPKCGKTLQSNGDLQAGEIVCTKGHVWPIKNGIPSLVHPSISKEDAVIKVLGNTAWVICDNIWKGTYEGEYMEWKSVQITFLEKIDGNWKFSCSTWIVEPEDEAEEFEEGSGEEEELE